MFCMYCTSIRFCDSTSHGLDERVRLGKSAISVLICEERLSLIAGKVTNDKIFRVAEPMELSFGPSESVY